MENKNQLPLQKVTRGISNIRNIRGTYSKETQALIEDIKRTIEEIETIREQFEFISNEELIDYVIFKEKAEQKRLSYLLNLAKACPELTNVLL